MSSSKLPMEKIYLLVEHKHLLLSDDVMWCYAASFLCFVVRHFKVSVVTSIVYERVIRGIFY